MELVEVPGPADPEKVRKELERVLKRRPTEYELNRSMKQQAEYREKIKAYRKRQERALKAQEEGQLFVPGGVPGPGRPPKVLESGTLALMKTHLTTEEKVALFDEWLEIARQSKSWRGIAEYLKTLIAYEEGTPTKRTSADGGGNVFIDKMVQIVKEGSNGSIYDGGPDDVSGRPGRSDERRVLDLLPRDDGGGVSAGGEDPDPGSGPLHDDA